MRVYQVVFAILIAVFFTIECSNEENEQGNNSNQTDQSIQRNSPSGDSDFSSLPETDASAAGIAITLLSYLESFTTDDQSFLRKHFYKDTFAHMRKYANFDFTESEFFSMLQQDGRSERASLEAKGYEKKYSIIETKDIGKYEGKQVHTFKVLKMVGSTNEMKIDTLYVFAINDKRLEFINFTEGIHQILTYKFNDDSIIRMLKKGLSDDYSFLISEMNKNIFSSRKWKLEAVGVSKNDLYKLDFSKKSKMVSEGIVSIPNQMDASADYLDIKLIDGRTQRSSYDITPEIMKFELPEIGFEHKYKLEESGASLYYFYLIFEDNGNQSVFAYKGYDY
jgi:hypothetical protein